MAEKIQHGNNANLPPEKEIYPIYTTNTITSKKESNKNSKVPVSPVVQENVNFAKECVDNNHK